MVIAHRHLQHDVGRVVLLGDRGTLHTWRLAIRDRHRCRSGCIGGGYRRGFLAHLHLAGAVRRRGVHGRKGGAEGGEKDRGGQERIGGQC